jgi:hypothetical protein
MLKMWKEADSVTGDCDAWIRRFVDESSAHI